MAAKDARYESSSIQVVVPLFVQRLAMLPDQNTIMLSDSFLAHRLKEGQLALDDWIASLTAAGLLGLGAGFVASLLFGSVASVPVMVFVGVTTLIFVFFAYREKRVTAFETKVKKLFGMIASFRNGELPAKLVWKDHHLVLFDLGDNTVWEMSAETAKKLGVHIDD